MRLINTSRSGNGLWPDRRLAVIQNIDGVFLIVPLEANVSEIGIEVKQLSFKKIRLKFSSAKWRTVSYYVTITPSATNASLWNLTALLLRRLSNFLVPLDDSKALCCGVESLKSFCGKSVNRYPVSVLLSEFMKSRNCRTVCWHYNGVIVGAMESQITGVSIVYPRFDQTQVAESIKAPRH